MTTEDKVTIKNCNMILIEKQKECQHYHLIKLRYMNILKVKKYYLLIKDK